MINKGLLLLVGVSDCSLQELVLFIGGADVIYFIVVFEGFCHSMPTFPHHDSIARNCSIAITFYILLNMPGNRFPWFP